VNILEYIRILRQRGWIIILAAVITAASALLFSKLQQPEYRSSIQVMIELARPDFGLTQSIKQLLRSYATGMWSKQRAQQVINRLDLLYTPEDLIGDVKIVPDESIMVIQIDVDNYDGPTADAIANAWAQLLVEWRNEQNDKQDKENRVFATIIDPATHHQIRPKTLINVAAGGIFGLVLGAVVVFILEWLEAGIVHDPRSLERETGLTIIGVIPPE